MPYAVVNHVRLEDPEQAAISTREVVLPRLAQLPGFVQAIFLEQDTHGFSVMVFETQDQAGAMARRLGAGEILAPAGIVFERQEVLRVVASS